MDVLAGGVAVPDLDHRARHRRAVLVHDARPQMDQLADGALAAVAGEVAAQRGQPPQQVLRAGELGGSQRPLVQRLRRPAQRGRVVTRLDALRLGARIATVDEDFHEH